MIHPKEENTKRKIVFVLCTALALSLTACGNNKSATGKSLSAPAASSTAASTVESGSSEAAAEPAANASSSASAPAESGAPDLSADDASVSSPSKPVLSEGDINECHIKILDATFIDDYNGSPAISVQFEFTNNSSDPLYFMEAAATRAFQDGTELEEVGLNDESEEAQNSTLEVKDGATLTCTRIFALHSQSDVEIKIGEPTASEDLVMSKIFPYGV